MSEPTPAEIRERIDTKLRGSKKLALRAQYLLATRRSEICGQYAFRGRQLELTEHRGRPVAVFNILGAKLKDEEDPETEVEPRPVALPLEERYEPWTRSIVEYIQKRGPDRKTFRFSDTTLYRAARKAFEGLQYKIREGRLYHWKPLSTHGLRHIRVSELINVFGLDMWDVTAFAGWSPKEAGMPKVMQRYADLQWRRYIDKLFKEVSS